MLFAVPCIAKTPTPKVAKLDVDFDTSMGRQHIEWGKTHKGDKKFKRNIAKRYQRLCQLAPEITQEPRIPKIIHQIWLGSPFPDKYKAWQETWLAHHPGWEYKLWTDDDIASLKLENGDLLERAVNYGQKSDILRYEILHQFGGLYVDIDFECFAPFDDLHHTYNFYAGISNGVRSFAINNAIFGSAPGHPLLRDCIVQVRKTLERHGDFVAEDADAQIQHVVTTTGPVFFSQCVIKRESKLDDTCIFLPPTYFFPFPFWNSWNIPVNQRSSFQMPESLAMHHWGHSWVDAPKSRGESRNEK